MKDYTFTLKYHLGDPPAAADDLVERLGEAGCTDALVGIGTAGRIALEFVREAETARIALTSALEDVRKAIPDAVLVEASPDLVGATELGELMGVSRQNIRKLMVANEDFPVPVHEGNTTLWHLADVLEWFDGRKNYDVEVLLETARITLEINLARQTRRSSREALSELEALVA